MNISLTKGEFSTDWKTAVVQPLLKKIGLELIHANFRSVSNLSFLSKLVEKCMLLQLSDHCKMFNLQPDYHSAYREDYSCETAVLGISNDILWVMEKQSITSLVTLDLSAAFDTVDHNTLLHILNTKYGIEDTALKWFDEYLRPRAFKVTINRQYSEPRDLAVSVPQGSCAGGNIFNLYCSPLQDVVPSTLQLSGFADDHSVRREFKARDREGESETICILEDCMLKIKQWMDETRLKMNTAKTEFIYFGNQHQLDKCKTDTIDVVGDLILRTNSVKYLGVQMDSNLNFKQLITQKCCSAMFNFLRIKSIRHLLDEDTTASLCLSLCISHLDYCNSFLYGLPETSIAKLQRIQNMCACLVLRRSKFESTTQALLHLHWLPVRQWIAFKILTLTYKCVHGIGPQYLQKLITKPKVTRSNLRSANDPYLLVIPTLWNRLPKKIRSAQTLLSFKKDLKTHLFSTI